MKAIEVERDFRGLRYLHQQLFNFTVNRVLAHDGVVFFQLHTIGRIFAVLLRDIARSARQAAVFVLGAFQDHLNAIAFAFFCHDSVGYFKFCGPILKKRRAKQEI